MRGRPTSVCRLRVQAGACAEQGWSELISNRTKRRLVQSGVGRERWARWPGRGGRECRGPLSRWGNGLGAARGAPRASSGRMVAAGR